MLDYESCLLQVAHDPTPVYLCVYLCVKSHEFSPFHKNESVRTMQQYATPSSTLTRKLENTNDTCERRKNLMTFAAITRCSQSRPAEGSSSRNTLAGFPRHRVMATRCSSPPEEKHEEAGERCNLIALTYFRCAVRCSIPLIAKTSILQETVLIVKELNLSRDLRGC